MKLCLNKKKQVFKQTTFFKTFKFIKIFVYNRISNFLKNKKNNTFPWCSSPISPLGGNRGQQMFLTGVLKVMEAATHRGKQ